MNEQEVRLNELNMIAGWIANQMEIGRATKQIIAEYVIDRINELIGEIGKDTELCAKDLASL